MTTDASTSEAGLTPEEGLTPAAASTSEAGLTPQEGQTPAAASTSEAGLTPPAGAVFAALADPTRWQVLRNLAERGEATATTLATDLPVSRVAVIKHLAVLDRAGLVTSRKQGREVRFTARPERLQQTAGWMNELATEWDRRLAAIKRLAEADGGAR
jgi:DNA-binding transcriptional ArsR family regulator